MKYALVPLEPTEAMLRAASELDANSLQERLQIWRDMLAAAPSTKLLEWSDPQPGNTECSYDHVTAETPFGRFLITWKSWKDYPGYSIDESPCRLAENEFGFINGGHTLEDTKRIAEENYRKHIAQALELDPEITLSFAGVVGDVIPAHGEQTVVHVPVAYDAARKNPFDHLDQAVLPGPIDGTFRACLVSSPPCQDSHRVHVDHQNNRVDLYVGGSHEIQHGADATAPIMIMMCEKCFMARQLDQAAIDADVRCACGGKFCSDQSYSEGWAAYFQGKPRTDQPSYRSPDDVGRWIEGWEDAAAEDSEE